MKLLPILFTFAYSISFLFTHSVHAQNDHLCNATLLTINEECNTVNIILEGSTAEADEPTILCTFPDDFVDSIVTHSVWFSFVAPASEIIIQADTDTATYNDDYIINLFELNGDCSDLSNLVNIDCDIPPNRLLQSPRVVTTLTEGESYFIQLSPRKFEFDEEPYLGPGCISINEVVPPINDDACNAITLELDAEPMIFSNQNATAQANEESIIPPVATDPFGLAPDGWSLADLAIEHSVWFKFNTPNVQGNITVDLLSSRLLFGNMNTQIAIYEVEECSDFSTFELIGASDNLFITTPSIVQAFSESKLSCLKANTTYYILVDGAGLFFGTSVTRKQGNFSIEVRFDGAAATSGIISTTDSTTICTDDEVLDLINVELEGGNGIFSEWVFVDADLNILDIPGAPPFNFENQGQDTLNIRHMYYDDLSPLDVGGNIENLEGCFDLSNSIEVKLLAGENCNLTSLSNTWTESAIKLSPNPTNDILEVFLDGINENNISATVCNLVGKEIMFHNLSDVKTSINVSTLPSGIYFLQLRSGNKRISKKFIKS